MHTLRVAMGIGFLCVFVYIAVTVAMQYAKESDKTGWARWRATAQDSATLLFGKFVALVAAGMGGIGQIADLLGAPEVKDWLNSHIGDAKVLSSVMLAIAVGIFMTRMRTVSTSKSGD
jgi:hypothetical protein